jgi:hypothetical protein
MGVQESAAGRSAAAFGGNMMVRSCTGVKADDRRSLQQAEGSQRSAAI